MKKRRRSTKSLTVKKRMIGLFAIVVIVFGVVGAFGVNQVIADSANNSTGSSVDSAQPVIAEDSGGGPSNAHVLVTSDNTGDNTDGDSSKTQSSDNVPSVNINNLSSYPQTGDADETGLVIVGLSMLVGLFAFYMKRIRKVLQN
ncbi:LPXTG cell wall anchor domain-containing protein [Companilactobacillus kedongensis]|uniref:LPXTG cell wall anchor domain-containing protein n=1 Tax=Companilactobacillus kedongensis TaxID=2486004 RepID=UPI000F77C820|nr:LPXTG cell wall anchor domain-containing protein [Companilactobacillus kedongensis]